jgi:diguanylate cyclase (GGDEF)-like protein
MMAGAAWTRWQPARQPAASGARVYLVPAVAVVTAIAVLVRGNFGDVYAPAVVLAAIALVLAVVRMCLMLGENARLLTTMRGQTMTDTLTGLANRRLLLSDLAERIEAASPEQPLLLVMYDLNGFKLYNDTFGHLAGDSLLTRLGQRLAVACQGLGRAYRMGGDEFCALLACPAELVDGCREGVASDVVARTVEALSEHGPGFQVDSCFGLAVVPREAVTATEALGLADERLYQQKDARPGNVRRQLRNAVMQALQEDELSLRDTHQGAGRLSTQVGRNLGLDDEESSLLARAAELHDIGKLAIPEVILDKPGPLDDNEWVFMRRHTLLGERLLAAAPALAALVDPRPDVGETIRCHHERFDGKGYPDGLAGEQIPLAARVICVCDAFDAMTTDRAYQPAMSRAAAIRQLQAGAGTQFDPRVVAAFVAALRSEHALWRARKHADRHVGSSAVALPRVVTPRG